MWPSEAGLAPGTEGVLPELVLHAPFVALEGKHFDKQSFAVLDTPGPNEAKVFLSCIHTYLEGGGEYGGVFTTGVCRY